MHASCTNRASLRMTAAIIREGPLGRSSSGWILQMPSNFANYDAGPGGR
jgi:hypothetical protein